ncbi:DUF3293 domain-containing protein [Catenovulum agarivorans]|uniref:DUF3293 domain-containing protein n=1 Tax=Catenovulum agarivorans TaxID=1172192 RepID=UPI00030C82EE|nr:DUF3293 domain-containing protein [Catenovulum agarivorans]
MQAIWQIYKNVVFEFGQPLSPRLNFAIITAHNPLGELCSAGQNAMLDRVLQRDITALGVPYRSLFGCDSTKSHMEKSWAIAIDKEIAITLAKNHKQNALYWVADDQLYLVPALMVGVQEEYIGRFSDKVISINAQLSVS